MIRTQLAGDRILAPTALQPKNPDPEPGQEALRRSVEYLAFRLTPAGLEARLDPGRERLAPNLERAAGAALDAHLEVSQAAPGAPSPIVAAAHAAQRRFARQLAEVMAGATRSPTMALRRVYLDALADVLVDKVGQVEA